MRVVLSSLALAVFILTSGGAAAADLLREAPRSRCAPFFPSDSSVSWSCFRLGRDSALEGLFGVWWKEIARFNRIDRRHVRPGRYIKVPIEPSEIKDFTPMPVDYPGAEADPKFILIDLSEQFLGAYENGVLVHSFPIASGEKENKTPAGEFRITAFSRNHRSSKYKIEGTETPYPMNYALRFFINREGVSYWIHGRDMPGRPASHGCIGLYDEQMQKKHYGSPSSPELDDARVLYEWAIGNAEDRGSLSSLKETVRAIVIDKGR